MVISTVTAPAVKGTTSDQAATRLPGLDGLRALAVLAVIAFHEQLTAFPGGFLGVDVFFVLSGYLITDLLVAQWNRHGRLGCARSGRGGPGGCSPPWPCCWSR